MEMTLKANGFQALSLEELLVLDGGEWSWSWSDFGRSTASNAAGGAAAGAIGGGISAGPAGIAGGAGVGALGGAAWGAVSYSTGQLWKGLFD